MTNNLKLLVWAFRLHILKWSRYRADVIIWMITIWLTLSMQAVFIFVTYNASGGDLFGYSSNQLIGFFGVTVFATGFAQCIVHGFIMHLAKVIWEGEFDYWLIQPVPLFMRMLLEDLGIIWFSPHVIVGAGIIFFAFDAEYYPIAFLAAIFAGILEMGLVICLSVPSIRWGKWDPNEGISEYIESSRSIPIGRAKNALLWLASFGVLHYSIALEVITGGMPIWYIMALATGICALAWYLLTSLASQYTSASS